MKIQYDVYQIIQDRKLAIERNKTTRQAMIEISYSLRTYGRSGAEIREYLREQGYPINSNNVYPINPRQENIGYD
ncbi:CoA-binding protein [Gammaproteobacteria bacterium]|nr:CoA-binding protein [Gammaproteobacteria bacterium]